MANKKPILLLVALIVSVAGGWMLIRHRTFIDRANPIVLPKKPTLEEPLNHGAVQQQVSSGVAAEFSRRAEFESAPDLFRFAVGLERQDSANDPEALWFIRRAKEYCAGFSSNPDKYASDTTLLASLANSDASQAVQAARERTAARCAGFPNQAYGVADDIRALQQAAKAGSISAEAALLAMREPLNESAEYKNDLVRRILESRDPEAFLAISESMDTPMDGNKLSGDQNAVFAWQIAACNRGLDCGPTGSLMTSYCANGGVCGNYRNFKDLVFNGMVARPDLRRIEFYLKQIQQAGELQ